MLTGAERKKACGCCDWDRHGGAQSLLLGTAIVLSLTALAALASHSYSPFSSTSPLWIESHAPITRPDECTTLFTLIGLTGSAAWLVSASDRKVLGVPIGQLLRWAYPSAVPGYFALFLPTILLGALSANSEARAATTLALLSAVLQFFCLMYINFRLLLSADQREHIVYAYYMDRLTACPVNDKKFSTPGILHMTAECARLLLTEEMRINSAETLALWHQAIYKLLCHDWNRDMEKKHPSASLENRADVVAWLQTREQRGEEAPCWLLKASDAWCILLRAPLSSTQKESAVQKLLYRMAHKKDPDYFTYMALLAGLVLALFRLHDQDQDGGKRLFSDLRLILGPVKQDTLDSLLSEETDEPIFRYELTRLQQRYLIGGFGIAAVLFRKINRQPRGDKSRFSLLAQYRDSYADEIPPAAVPVAAGSAEEAHRLTGFVEPSHIYLDATQEVTGDPPPSQAEIFARLCSFQAPDNTDTARDALFSAQLELVLWLVEWGYRTQYGISYKRFIDWCGPGASAAMNRYFTISDDDPYYRTKFLREMIKREKTDGK